MLLPSVAIDINDFSGACIDWSRTLPSRMCMTLVEIVLIIAQLVLQVCRRPKESLIHDDYHPVTSQQPGRRTDRFAAEEICTPQAVFGMIDRV